MSGPGGDTNDAGPVRESRIQVQREGRVAATANVTSTPEPHGTAKVTFHSQRDVAAEGARRELVDQVLDRPEVSNSDGLHVVVPVGDSESITELQRRTTNFRARAAGSSSIIEADVVPPSERRD